ncbi:hypothetical protein CSAL01_00692 [Colletotrichum salicis]|uniref:Uncharacterized protein n=1 Tax=Colletotrichum salicis TaxID=1209931 RepID=A0A135S3G9_9PEZI|nr:hypothetical protein CSAL01_00692 [Colletotrichum salicis]
MQQEETGRHMATMLVLRIERGRGDKRYVPYLSTEPGQSPRPSWMKYPSRIRPYSIAAAEEHAPQSAAEPGPHGVVGKPIRRGRVIGMAVCVTSDGTKRYAEHGVRLKEKMNGNLDID